MKIFFDMEFTGLQKNSSVISIGLVDQNDRCFYAECSDYDKTQVNDWIKKNIITNLWFNDKPDRYRANEDSDKTFIKGKKDFVKQELLKWLSIYDKVEWVADVAHYDFVLLIDLLYGHALNVPYGKVAAAVHDINQDISNYYKISDIDAFDKNRESILKSFNKEPKYQQKHNALYDAIVCRDIYNIINKTIK